MEKQTVTVTEHTFLDMSKGYFVKINGVKTGGEITTKREAIEIGKELAQELDCYFDTDIHTSNEMF